MVDPSCSSGSLNQSRIVSTCRLVAAVFTYRHQSRERQHFGKYEMVGSTKLIVFLRQSRCVRTSSTHLPSLQPNTTTTKHHHHHTNQRTTENTPTRSPPWQSCLALVLHTVVLWQPLSLKKQASQLQRHEGNLSSAPCGTQQQQVVRRSKEQQLEERQGGPVIFPPRFLHIVRVASQCTTHC